MEKLPRSARMDYEFQKILIEARETTEKATSIRDFLLNVLQEDVDGKVKFNEEILQEAAELIKEVRPGGLYWMADVAIQMITLAPSALREMPTNVEAELGKDASAEEVIRLVVRV